MGHVTSAFLKYHFLSHEHAHFAFMPIWVEYNSLYSMPAQLKFLIMRTESLVLLSTHPTPQSISTFTADTQQGNPTVLYSKLDGVFLSLSSSLSPNCPEEGSILIYQAISGNNRVTNRIVLEHIVIPVFLHVNHRNKSLPVVS